MSTISRFRLANRFLPLVAAFALAGVTAACNDEGPDDEPQVQTIRLVIGTGASAQTINIDRLAAAANFTITRAAHPVVATFLRANGDPEPLVNETEFELRLDGLNAAVATFARTSAFTGTLTGVAAGNSTVTVRLFHLEEGHADFEKSGTITVTN